jgi:antirestriction protein ArdC
MEQKKKPYERAAEKLIAQLEAGTVPWRKPWKSVGLPRNLVSQKLYRGMNTFILLLEDRPSPCWLTYRQAMQLGGHVMQGEKGTAICKYSVYDRKTKNEETGEEGSCRSGYLKVYTVFNLVQCNPELAEGLGLSLKPTEKLEDLPAAQAIWDNYPNRPQFQEANAAFYRPSEDLIGMPARSAFKEQREYYNTLFHEMIHSTGAVKRLGRDAITDPIKFGSHKYAEEELVAEFGASMLSAMCGMQPEVIENSAAYVKHWLDVLKASDNKKMLQHAITQAQKACDHIGVSAVEEGKPEEQAEQLEAVAA